VAGPSKVVDKAKESLAATRTESRFKVVGARRNIDVDELDDDNLFHLVDIVQVSVFFKRLIFVADACKLDTCLGKMPASSWHERSS